MSENTATITTPAGLDWVGTITLRKADRSPILDTYDGTEPLQAECWGGDDQVVLFEPEAEWDDPAAGTVTLAIPGYATAGLDPGIYRLRLVLTDGTAVLPAWSGELEIEASPGSGTPRPVYCSEDDMLAETSQLRELQVDSDQAGYREQRAAAREWVDGNIQAHTLGRFPNRDYTLDHLLPAPYQYRLDGADDPVLQALLDDNRLVLTGPQGRRLVRAAALYACHLVFKRQIGPATQGAMGTVQSPFAAMARSFLAEAQGLVSTSTARIDDSTAGDGSSYQTVHLGSHRGSRRLRWRA